MKPFLLLAIAPFFTFAQSHDPSPYCIEHSSEFRAGTVITSVHFNTLNFVAHPTPVFIPQTDASQPWFGYNYYDTIPATKVHIDSTYQLTVGFDYQATTPYQPIYYSVWIDFDHNNHFDSSETVLNNVTSGVLPNHDTTKTIQVTIPNTAHIGLTRMRILRREQFATFSTNHWMLACSANSGWQYGESQDYNIEVTDTIPQIDTPTNIFSITPSSVQQAHPNPSKGIFYIDDVSIDLSGYPSGFYYRKVKNKWYKLVKE